MTEKLYKNGEVIFKEGSVDFSMYELLEGSVGVYAHYGQPDEKQLTVLQSGAFFGEMGLVDARPRSATVVALSDVKLDEITAENFADYFEEKPQRVHDIMAHMSERIRKLSEDYLEVCRAASEINGNAGSGKKKSNWLLQSLEKFAELASGLKGIGYDESSGFDSYWL
jgi:CRP-like cAMP-binding protein